MPNGASSITSPCSIPRSPRAAAAASRSAGLATAKLTWSSPTRVDTNSSPPSATGRSPNRMPFVA